LVGFDSVNGEAAILAGYRACVVALTLEKGLEFSDRSTGRALREGGGDGGGGRERYGEAESKKGDNQGAFQHEQVITHFSIPVTSGI
jgi:hypothetical protein